MTFWEAFLVIPAFLWTVVSSPAAVLAGAVGALVCGIALFPAAAKERRRRVAVLVSLLGVLVIWLSVAAIVWVVYGSTSPVTWSAS